MKTNILSFTVLAALLAVGCSKTEVQPQSWRTDPDAVIVNASIGTLTRSNPLGSSSEQQTFNVGDEITITQPNVGSSVIYKFDGTSWSPVGGDYLVWSDKGKTFEAWYPSKDPSFVTDQSTLEGIAKADVMNVTQSFNSIPSDHRLNVNFYRLRSLVTVRIKDYNDEFDPATDKITDMKVYLAENSYSRTDQAVKPYVRDASGAGQASDAAGTVGFSYSAIGLRATGSESNLFIEFKVGEKTLTVKGCPILEAGKAYTFNLTVGKARIEASDVTVSDWSDPVDLNEGNEFEADIDGEVWDGTVATSFESGTGTETDPYIIATPSQLAYLAQQVNSYYSSKNGSIYAFEGKYFRQTNDFVLADKPWTPIGCDYSYGGYSGDRYFAGHYDGNGKKVYGLNVVKKDKAYSGLFGVVSKGSIAKCTVFGRIDASTYTGGIVGCMVGGATMTNCAAEVTVRGKTNVGGLCGSINGASVSGCSVMNCLVDGVQNVGSLVGYISGENGSAALKDCSASGIVTGARYVGGVVGYVGNNAASMEISGCTVNADLTVLASVTTTGKWGKTYEGAFCGGLAGFVDYKTEDKPGSAKFSDCGFNGTITKGGKDVENVGAAIGCDQSDATFTGCWYNADKTGDLPLVALIERDAVGKEYTGIEARHLGN